MKNQLLNITNEMLDKLDLSHLESFGVDEWFSLPSSKEHYRLLAHVSTLCSGNIIDIGTHKGMSALAFSNNENVQVDSYDIVHNYPLFTKDNVTFHIENVLTNKETLAKIEKASVISIDTMHDGSFEREMLKWLLSSKFKGVVMFDDIHLNYGMEKFWRDECTKLDSVDLSKIGHWSGTGVVFF